MTRSFAPQVPTAARLPRGRFFGMAEPAVGTADVAVSITRYPPHTCIALHAHTGPYLSFVMAGDYLERIGSTALKCPALTVRFHPAGEEHANEFGSAGACCLNLEPSPRWQESLDQLPKAHRAPIVLESAGALGLRAAAVCRAAVARVECEECEGDGLTGRNATRDQRLEIESLVAELLAVCQSATRRHQAAERSPAIRRALEFIEAELDRPFSLATVAVAARLHPTHFARSFRSLTGMTLGEYVRRRRLARAESLIVSHPSATLSRVAIEAGFADHAHMTRNFRRTAGFTPSAVRAAMIREGVLAAGSGACHHSRLCANPVQASATLAC